MEALSSTQKVFVSYDVTTNQGTILLKDLRKKKLKLTHKFKA